MAILFKYIAYKIKLHEKKNIRRKNIASKGTIKAAQFLSFSTQVFPSLEIIYICHRIISRTNSDLDLKTLLHQAK